MSEENSRARTARAEKLLALLDRLLLDEPKTALIAAQPLPVLVDDLDPDVKARAYACLGLAQLKNGDETSARRDFDLAREIATNCPPATRALVKLRASSLLIRSGRYTEAEHELGEALKLASEDPTGPLLGRIYLKRGNLAVLQSRFAEAATEFSRALDTLPPKHFLREVAAWNLMLAVHYFNGREAAGLLKLMRSLDLRCARSLARKSGQTVPACLICWVEGYLHGYFGSYGKAARCLAWAATTLHELGEVREATLCALDLVAIDPAALPKVAAIVESLIADSQTPATVAQAARLWLSWPATHQNKVLRTYLLRGQSEPRGGD